MPSGAGLARAGRRLQMATRHVANINAHGKIDESDINMMHFPSLPFRHNPGAYPVSQHCHHYKFHNRAINIHIRQSTQFAQKLFSDTAAETIVDADTKEALHSQ